MRCLNLKLTYACTNRCSFCFSSYLKDEVIGEAGLLREVEEGYRRGCRELVLSGGEPTLCPDTLLNVMKRADEVGYQKYIIQTNGSGFSNHVDLALRIGEFARKAEVAISFSIHGHTSQIHDEMSGTPGAFEKLMCAMHRVRDEGSCIIYTNTVMSRTNLPWLPDLARMLIPFQPEIMQFSMMHLKQPGPFSTGLLEAANAVRALDGIVDRAILRTEGIPYCLLYGMETCVGESYWPNTLDLYNRDSELMTDFDQLGYGMRWKKSGCRACLMDEICMGIWREHAEEFSRSGVRPICEGGSV